MWINLAFSVDGVWADVDKHCCAGKQRVLAFGVIHKGYPQCIPLYPQGFYRSAEGRGVTRLFHFSYFQYFLCRFSHYYITLHE